MGAAWLKTVEEAVAFARRKHTVGDRWERVGVEEWDMVAGKGRIDYRHCDEGEAVFVVEVFKAAIAEREVDAMKAWMEDRRAVRTA